MHFNFSYKLGLVLLGAGLLASAFAHQISAQSTAASCDVTSVLPKLQSIQLIPNADTNYQFFITADAQMPTLKFNVDFSGELTDADKTCLRQSLSDKFDWSVSVAYWDGVTKDTHKILPTKLGAQRSGLVTGDGWQYAVTGQSAALTITPDQLGKFGGGADGTVSVKLNLPDKTLTASMPIQIWAQSVNKTAIKLYLGELKYQLLGYLESKFIHIYNGTPLLNCGDTTCSVSDGGFGLMQITDCRGAAGTLGSLPGKQGSGHGFPSYTQIWNWQANAAAGKSCFDIKVNQACRNLAAGSESQLKCGYTGYNGSSSYGELGVTILNEMQHGRFRAGWF